MNVLVLAALTEATGNAVTAQRIARHLAPRFSVTLVDATTATSEGLRETIAKERIVAAVGVHALLAGPFLRGAGVPYCLVFGGTDLYESTHALQQKSMARAVEHASRLIAFSPENRARAEWLWPATAGRVQLLPQAVETLAPDKRFSLRATLGLGRDDVLVLLPTGIRRVKDPLHVVEAFSAWHRARTPLAFSGPNRRRRVHLAVVGAVLEPDYAEVALPALSEAPGVHYHPALPRPRMLAAVQEADVVINTSLGEGMCGAVLEAMALGTPVIARRNAGNESLVSHGHTGLLYDDPDELVNWLKALITSHALGERIAQTARARVATVHSEAAEGTAYLRLLDEIVEDTGGGSFRAQRPGSTSPSPAGNVPRHAPVGRRPDKGPDELDAVADTAERLGMPPRTTSALATFASAIRREHALHATVHELIGLLATAPPSVAIRAIASHGFDDTLGAAGARRLYLLLALSQVRSAEARFLARGIELSTIAATLSDLRVWAEHLQALLGHGGITLERLAWAQRYLRGELFQVGVLQLDLEPFSAPVRVFRHRRTRELSATTLSGGALDLKRGTVGVGRAPTHDAADWEIALEPGSPVLEMWIPGSTGLVTMAEVVASMRQALALFARISPETTPVAVAGESWRLDPQLETFLPFEPSVHGLLRLCQLFPSALSEQTTIRRLFGPDVDRATLRSLPRETLGPIHRAIAEFLQAPERHLVARGGFVLNDAMIETPEWQ